MPKSRDQDLIRAVGRRLASARRARGYTQEALAEALGIEPVTLSRLETGDRAVSLSTLGRVAEVLHVALGDLVDESQPLPEPEHGPEEAELLRLFGSLSPDRRTLMLKLARELAS